MPEVFQYALRGALGFMLAGAILAVGVGMAAGSRGDDNPSQGFVGRWQGKRSPDPSAVRVAEFGPDRSVTVSTAGATLRGSFTEEDPSNVRLVLEGPWTRASLKNGNEVHLLNDDGTRAQRLERESSASAGIGRLVLFLLPFLGGAVAVGVLTLDTRIAVRGAVGFGLGAIPASAVVLFTAISLQGGGAPSYSWGALGCGTGFALAGAIGAACLWPRLVLAGAASFGVAGALGGASAFWFVAHPPAAWVSIGSVLGTFALAGGLFGVAFGVLAVDE